MHRHILCMLLAAAVIAWTGCKEEKGECGNNNKDKEELCDGDDRGGENCQDRGFLGGTLYCLPDCTGFNEDLCTGGCGNNVAEGPAQGLDEDEPCDGSDIRGQNCTIEGYELGDVTCLADCSGFDTTACRNPDCGDGSIEGSEDCEDGVPLRDTCTSLGYNEGDLACGSDCHYDESGCVTWVCGNSVLEGLEQCDTDIFRDDETCESLGHDEGELSCYPPEHETPCTFNVETCTDWVCGDGTVEGDEDCEPGETFTEDCVSEGFLSGTLACTAADDLDRPCLWDFSACVGGCGNNIIEGIADGLTADELCDGTNLDGETCETVGTFSGGDLACQPTCDDWDTTGCIT